MRLGPKIRDVLDRKGMTQRELARRACVSEQYLSVIMTKDTSPSSDLLWRIAAVLGVTVDDLMDPEGRAMGRPAARAKDDGHVKVLMSFRFNNFEARRPLPPDATDEEYDAEFAKAMRSVQRALERFERLTEMQIQFNQLRAEYEYLTGVEEEIKSRDLSQTPLTDAEKMLLTRVGTIRTILENYHDPDVWENMLYREGDESDVEW